MTLSSGSGRSVAGRGAQAGVERGRKRLLARWAAARKGSGCDAGLLGARGGWAMCERTGERRGMGRGETGWASALGPCGRKKRADWAAGKGWAGLGLGFGGLGLDFLKGFGFSLSFSISISKTNKV